MSVCSLRSDTFCWITVKCYNAYTMTLQLTLYLMTQFFFYKFGFCVFLTTHDQFSYKASGRVCFHEYDFPRVRFPLERHLYLENGTPSPWPMELDVHCTCESLQQRQHFSFASGDLLLICFSISPFVLYGHLMHSSF